MLLVGGSVHIPQVCQVIRSYFPEEVKVEKDPYPDLVVAKGAAVMAGITMGTM